MKIQEMNDQIPRLVKRYARENISPEIIERRIQELEPGNKLFKSFCWKTIRPR
jgi:hypothetical protein